MSVDTTTRKASFTMDGSTVDFDFTFRALVSAPTDIKAKIREIATGDETDLDYTTDYTVAVNADGVGGTVTVVDAESSAYQLIVYRETTKTQESSYNDFNQFPAATLENNIDKMIMLAQELSEDIDRALKLPISSTLSSISIPDASPNKLIGWNSAGTALENKDGLDESIDACDSYATIATNQAINAAASAVTASSHATTASGEATAAASSSTVAASEATTAISASTVAVSTSATALQSVEEDTSPTLGGNLDLNNYDIYSGASIILRDDTGGIFSTPSQSAISVYLNTNTAVSASTTTTIPYNTEIYDTQNEFNPTTHRFTATKVGIYQVCASCRVEDLADNQFLDIRASINGTLDALFTIDKGSEPLHIAGVINKQMLLTAGDYLELTIYHTGSSAKNITGQKYSTYLTITKIA